MPHGIDYNFQDSEQNQKEEELIHDRSKLELGYIPEEIRHRGDQMQQLARQTLSDVANGNKGTDSIVMGPPGTGKTATVRHMLEKTEENNEVSDFRIEYINCSTNSSGQAVFKTLCESIGATFKAGVALPENINRFKQKLEEKDISSLLIVLDEIQELAFGRFDYLSKPVLYQLSRPEETSEESYGEVSITVIGISNDEDIFGEIDRDVKSSLEGPAKVHFPRYTEDEIVDILQGRQEKAYSHQVLSKAALRKIAREVSDNFDGDVRKGIEILKKIPKNAKDIGSVDVDVQQQLDIVDRIICELQRDCIKSEMYSEEDDFYIVMSSLYQQIIHGEARLKYITEGYSQACEKTMREKKGNNWSARKSYVYRQLEKLVDADLLSKTKDHSKQSKPSRYEPNFDPEIFKKIVDDMLQRKSLLENVDRHDYAVESFEEEAREKMDELVESSDN